MMENKVREMTIDKVNQENKIKSMEGEQLRMKEQIKLLQQICNVNNRFVSFFNFLIKLEKCVKFEYFIIINNQVLPR